MTCEMEAVKCFRCEFSLSKGQFQGGLTITCLIISDSIKVNSCPYEEDDNEQERVSREA